MAAEAFTAGLAADNLRCQQMLVVLRDRRAKAAADASQPALQHIATQSAGNTAALENLGK